MLPLAGYRDYDDGVVYDQGDDAYYRSSSPRGGSRPERAWYLDISPAYVFPGLNYDRAGVLSLRCFKNSYAKVPETLNLVPNG